MTLHICFTHISRMPANSQFGSTPVSWPRLYRGLIARLGRVLNYNPSGRVMPTALALSICSP